MRRLAPEIEWGAIIGMRNILVHGYFEIDADIVWHAAQRDAPALKPAVKRLLKKLERNEAKAKTPPPKRKKPGRKKKGGGK